MELHLKLIKINERDINREILDNNILLAIKLKNEILEKRKKFATILRKIKNIYIEKSKLDAYHQAKEEYLNEFFKANNFYHQSILKANTDCLEVSLKVAKEIIEKEINEDLNILINKIDSELDTLNGSEKYRVKCNSKIAEEFKKNGINILTVVDNNLSNKEALLISNAGSIKIDIENEFVFLKSKLEEELYTLCL